jgi:hypothetical protein
MAKHATASDAAKNGDVPWWLDVGEEDCPHCEQTYTYEAEVRCFECDAPICRMCIVRVREHVLCPECRKPAKAK